MIDYILELKMANKNFPITSEMETLLSICANEASSTVVSQKNKRTFSILSRIDDYTLLIKITSKNEINPTRTFSTLTRAVTNNPTLYSLVKNQTVNGMIFSTRLIESQNSQIIHLSDTEIVSEIISIFFKNDYFPKEQLLASETASKVRELIIDFKNNKINL